MSSRRNYANPPLVEALCELRFDPGRPWDWAVPGLVYTEIRESFPVREDTEDKESTGQADAGAATQPARRVRFFSPEKTSLVQIGKDTLVFNHLRPYPGWAQFRSLLLMVVEKYKRAAEPKGVQACSLRYINRIPVPSGVVITDYLVSFPSIPSNLPDTLSGWSLSLDIPHLENGGLIRIESWASPPREGRDAGFIIDLSFTSFPNSKLDFGEALETWIDGAHRVIEDTFEASITENARATFEEEEVSHDQLPSR